MRTLDDSWDICSGIDIEQDMEHSKWMDDLAKANIKRSDMNHLIMNYLVMEGFKEAAEKFAEEAKIAPPQMMNYLDERIKVTHALKEGKIEEAMRMVTALYPEILDDNDHLFFHLQQLVLIELIRNNKVEEAVSYAQENLAEKGVRDPAVLTQLERTLALLAFESPEKSPFADLLLPSHRLKVACELNAAMLEAQQHETTVPKLSHLLKLLLWSQEQLSKHNVKFPLITDLSDATIEMPKTS